MHLYYLPIRKAPENCECQLDAGRLKVWPESIAPLLDIGLDRDETDCINLGLSHADESADYSTWYGWALTIQFVAESSHSLEKF